MRSLEEVVPDASSHSLLQVSHIRRERIAGYIALRDQQSSSTLGVKIKKINKERRRRRTREEKKNHLPGEMIQGIGESREANKVGAISKGGWGVE